MSLLAKNRALSGVGSLTRGCRGAPPAADVTQWWWGTRTRKRGAGVPPWWIDGERRRRRHSAAAAGSSARRSAFSVQCRPSRRTARSVELCWVELSVLQLSLLLGVTCYYYGDAAPAATHRQAIQPEKLRPHGAREVLPRYTRFDACLLNCGNDSFMSDAWIDWRRWMSADAVR